MEIKIYFDEEEGKTIRSACKDIDLNSYCKVAILKKAAEDNLNN